jgi:hypothetical protein
MPQIRTPRERAQLAEAYSLSAKIVNFAGALYLPVHFLTKAPSPILKKSETIWMPLDAVMLRAIANLKLDILFESDGVERSFRLMIEQYSKTVLYSRGLLVRWGKDKTKVLMPDGTWAKHKGEFGPNYLDVPFQENNPLTMELFTIISGWVGGDEQAHSLLFHLATALQNEWSAVKYVLLIGEGRNGKGTLIAMLEALFGSTNISHVTRQDMSIKSPIISTLNGKLLNLVYDGPKEFLKDSSIEKTLIAGEPAYIEMKYENAPRKIQTNALWVEALNTEPRVSDKSPALQKRLARFKFKNVYPLNHEFHDKMLSPEMLGAFLELLLLHFVHKKEVGTKLLLTAESLDMQMDAMWDINPVFRFLEYTHGRDNKFLDSIVNGKMIWSTFIDGFRLWLENNGYRNMEDDYLMTMMKNSFIDGRKSFRVSGKPTTQRYIAKVLPDTANAIEVLRSGELLAPVSKEDLAILEGDGE